MQEWLWTALYGVVILISFRLGKMPKLPLWLIPISIFQVGWAPSLLDRLIAIPLIAYGYQFGVPRRLMIISLIGFLIFRIDLGNSNMSAQAVAFLALALPYGSMLALPYATLVGCRSVILGASLSISRRLSIFIIVGLITFGVSNSSNSLRIELISAAIKLIAEKPFGRGVGNFEFDQFKFHPAILMDIAKTPHNEFLRYAVEDGIQFLILVFYFGSILIRNGNWQLILILGSEMLFQFPMMLPIPFAITFLFIGESLREREFWKFDFRIMIPILIILAIIFSLGRLGPDELACRLYPGNWKACINTAILRRDAELIKRQNPNNPVAKELLQGLFLNE